MVWTEFAALAASYDLSAASFDLPRFEVPRLPATQTAFLLDDNDKRSELRLDSGRGLDPSPPTDTVKLNKQLSRDTPPNNTYPLIATDIATDATGPQLVLGFPSLAKLGIGPDSIDDARLALRREPAPLRYLNPLRRRGLPAPKRAGRKHGRPPERSSHEPALLELEPRLPAEAARNREPGTVAPNGHLGLQARLPVVHLPRRLRAAAQAGAAPRLLGRAGRRPRGRRQGGEYREDCPRRQARQAGAASGHDRARGAKRSPDRRRVRRRERLADAQGQRRGEFGRDREARGRHGGDARPRPARCRRQGDGRSCSASGTTSSSARPARSSST